LVASDPDIRQVVAIMDTVFILIFGVDLLRRLHVAGDDRAYIIHRYGWLDLISIIPMLRIARLLRIGRIIRVMRRMGGGRALRVFFANRATGGLLSVFLVAIVVFEFGAIAMLWAEDGAEGARILTGSDALWYLVVTMSTVGYGDLFPVTDTGRLIGTIIIVMGVGVFGTLTGFLANAFLSPSKD
jgi:voltage-gated potassium channel